MGFLRGWGSAIIILIVSASVLWGWFFLRWESSSRFLAGRFGKMHMFVFVGRFLLLDFMNY